MSVKYFPRMWFLLFCCLGKESYFTNLVSFWQTFLTVGWQRVWGTWQCSGSYTTWSSDHYQSPFHIRHSTLDGRLVWACLHTSLEAPSCTTFSRPMASYSSKDSPPVSSWLSEGLLEDWEACPVLISSLCGCRLGNTSFNAISLKDDSSLIKSFWHRIEWIKWSLSSLFLPSTFPLRGPLTSLLHHLSALCLPDLPAGPLTHLPAHVLLVLLTPHLRHGSADFLAIKKQHN